MVRSTVRSSSSAVRGDRAHRLDLLQSSQALLVAVEVALSDDRPSGAYIADPPACRISAVHQPRRRVAAGVTPGNVALAVAVEVMGGGNPGRYSV
jgi:hypothetical protein